MWKGTQGVEVNREQKGESEGERGRRRLEKLKERGVGCKRYTHKVRIKGDTCGER